MTGLTGPHDFELSISLQSLAALYQELGVTLPLPPGLPEGPALMTTVQEDLGLKLDSQARARRSARRRQRGAAHRRLERRLWALGSGL
jgi:uncharacterized protein (TIGR03435 family)